MVKTVQEYLSEIDYRELNEGAYQPSVFSLKFMNFMKLVQFGEDNLTPVLHLKMLDGLVGKKENIVNLCFRGASKTTVFGEYLSLFLAVFGSIDGFGTVNGFLYISDSMDNGVKNFRSNLENKYNLSPFLQFWLPNARFTENFIEFTRKDGSLFGIRMYGAQSGIRGTKIYGRRPQFVLMDDLIQSDEDAASEAVLSRIKNNIYKAIIPALDPDKRKIVFNGTPFNENDPLHEAVNSGNWHVNVWPVCEEWPCTEEEFVSAWPDRFSYSVVKKNSELTGSAFFQEMMLQIANPEDRLIADSEITKFNLASWKKTRPASTFYITTDFATTEKKKGDYSVLSVWAVDSKGNFHWVDGVCAKQNMGKNVDSLFDLVTLYNPMGVAIEVAGQQGGFIPWLQREMQARGIFFNLLSNKGTGSAPGIRVSTSKLQRLNEILPLIKAGKIVIPEETDLPWVAEFWAEIRLAMKGGIKSKHDDVLDTVSQLIHVVPILPSPDVSEGRKAPKEDSVWYEEPTSEVLSGYSSYLV